MDFVSNKETQIQEMLQSIGREKILDLFSAIPPSILLPAPLEDDGLSELEGMRLMESLAAKNSFLHLTSYLGAGSYQHYIPAIVPSIISKSEFLTSYTPYQAEASQGTLETIFEFQSAIASLTGLDVANASVWDAAAANAEAVLMAMRIKKGSKRLLIAETLNPHYEKVIEQYLSHSAMEVIKIGFLPSGELNLDELEKHLTDDTAAFILQSPNVLGVVENSSLISEKVKSKGALVIQSGNPLAYGIYAPPGETGVDIAVGDMQPFGIPLNFGGPYAGYMVTKDEYVRQLPGRIVGEATDSAGKKGYVLALQAREQHIRREKALSNICTNQALMALSSLVSMLYYGKEGVKALALTNFQRASYLKSLLPNTLEGPIFNEFTVRLTRPIEIVRKAFLEKGIDPGWEPLFLKNHLVIAVTELKTKEDLDRFAEVFHDTL